MDASSPDPSNTGEHPQFPGAWSEPTSEPTAGQVYEDFSNLFSQVGQAAYNALPRSIRGIKDNFSPQSPIPTARNTTSAPVATMSSPDTTAASTLSTSGSLAYSKTNADDLPESPSDNIHTLPSTETEGTLPASGPVGGVGALPGPITEEGVALLPEERVNPDPLHLDDSQIISDTPTNESNIVGQPPSEAFNALRLDDPNPNNSEPKTAEILAPGPTLSPPTFPGHGTDVPPPSSTFPASSASIPVPASAPEPKSKTPPSSSSSLSSDTNAKKEKVSFMDKIKGEVKIFSGKMANDEAKVEAGKALKNGTGAGGRASPGKKRE